ncbi:MAG TPA: putative baseplate assembly protein, partial [Schlesneria sp.]|jgi:hypothetical protein
LELAEEPTSETDTLDANQPEIELDDVHIGLRVDKPLFFEGIPSFLEQPSANSSQAPRTSTHFAKIVSVRHFVDDKRFGDRFRTRLTLSNKLPVGFYLSTARIYANVVEATHGETQREVLGSGDGFQEFQKFLLKRPEVTQLVVPNERGIKSTLVVKVNDVEWTEQDSLRDAKAVDEQFVTQTNDDQQRTVFFGDGDQGARLPTGVENVRAEYRTGLGRKGNVAGGQINQLLGAPLGVKKVNNPLDAKGGADPESADLARAHAPLAVTAMDRLVSVQDYEDFARTYAGIGKASASLLQGGVQVTIAGLDPEPLEQDNPLFKNLQRAFEIFGDPSQQFQLVQREASLLILIARIKLKPRYEWEKVQPQIREALQQQFQYSDRDLGQDVLLSDAISTVQKIDGVLYVDVDKFDAVKQDEVSNLALRLKNASLMRRARVHVDLARFTTDADELADLPKTTRDDILKARHEATSFAIYDEYAPRLRAAQLCYLTPDIPDTLILEQIPS